MPSNFSHFLEINDDITLSSWHTIGINYHYRFSLPYCKNTDMFKDYVSIYSYKYNNIISINITFNGTLKMLEEFYKKKYIIDVDDAKQDIDEFLKNSAAKLLKLKSFL